MIKIISHRGNLNGLNPDTENKPHQIDLAIKNGFDVEIDLWLVDDNFFLGHDKPIDKIELSWLKCRSSYLWVHCKNIELLNFFVINKVDLNYFFHQKDDVALTSKFFLWVYPKKKYTSNSILVCNNICDFNLINSPPYGICTDFPLTFKQINEIKM